MAENDTKGLPLADAQFPERPVFYSLPLATTNENLDLPASSDQRVNVGTPDCPGSPPPIMNHNLLGQPERSSSPADRGRDAWLFLVAGFLMEAVVWGFPFSFGVFQNYYTANAPFAGSSGIAAIGTCAIGVSFLGFPLVVLLQRLYPRATRFAPLAGLLVMSATLIRTSFSTSVSQLMITQGVLYAVSAIVCYCPCILYIEEWFVARRGLAFGILWSGTGTGGFGIPPLMEFLLRKYGFQTALRIWAVALLIITMPLVYFIKPRLPIGSSTNTKSYKLTFLLNRTYLWYQFANMAESVGFFLPIVYLPMYTRDTLGAGKFLSALTVMLINSAAVPGMIAMGWLTDKFGVQTCIAISTVGTTLATFLIWGLATNMAGIYAFCILYGLFASSYASIWPVMSRHVIANVQKADDKSTKESKASLYDPAMMIGFLVAGRGVANIVSGPASEVLIQSSPWNGEASAAWGSGYGPLVAFTGVSAILGGTTILGNWLGWMDR